MSAESYRSEYTIHFCDVYLCPSLAWSVSLSRSLVLSTLEFAPILLCRFFDTYEQNFHALFVTIPQSGCILRANFFYTWWFSTQSMHKKRLPFTSHGTTQSAHTMHIHTKTINEREKEKDTSSFCWMRFSLNLCEAIASIKGNWASWWKLGWSFSVVVRFPFVGQSGLKAVRLSARRTETQSERAFNGFWANEQAYTLPLQFNHCFYLIAILWCILIFSDAFQVRYRIRSVVFVYVSNKINSANLF